MSTFRFLTHIGRTTFTQQKQRQIMWLRLGSFHCGKNTRCLTFFSNTQHADKRHCANQTLLQRSPWHSVELLGSIKFSTSTPPQRAGKSETKASAAIAESEIFGEASNLGLFAKFKLMWKKYWYVMIPVHVVTSVFWFGGFYYMSKSGVDVAALLQHVHLSETLMEKVHNSGMGHYAIAYLCYKVATPLRYAVTLGGTTVTIKQLVQAGYIKPMPSKQEFVQMYKQKKADIAAAKAEKESKKDEDK